MIQEKGLNFPCILLVFLVRETRHKEPKIQFVLSSRKAKIPKNIPKAFKNLKKPSKSAVPATRTGKGFMYLVAHPAKVLVPATRIDRLQGNQ